MYFINYRALFLVCLERASAALFQLPLWSVPLAREQAERKITPLTAKSIDLMISDH